MDSTPNTEPGLLSESEIAYIAEFHGISRIEIGKLLGHTAAQQRIIARLEQENKRMRQGLEQIKNDDCGCPAKEIHHCGNDHYLVKLLRGIAEEALNPKDNKP